LECAIEHPPKAWGRLVTNSGYAMFGGMGGNVLPVFGVNSAAHRGYSSTPK